MFLFQVAYLTGVGQDTIRDSVLNKKFDDLSSMYHLLMYNTRYPDKEVGTVSSPLLFSPKLVTEGDQVC